MEKVLNYIGGELVPASSGAWLDKPEPATGESYAQVPDSDEPDVQRAVEAAARAFPAWAATPAAERSRMLRRIADAHPHARSTPSPAPSPSTPASRSRVARHRRHPAQHPQLRVLRGRGARSSPARRTPRTAWRSTTRCAQPLGVVGCISPWNLPLYLLTWKIAPALAAGNCVRRQAVRGDADDGVPARRRCAARRACRRACSTSSTACGRKVGRGAASPPGRAARSPSPAARAPAREIARVAAPLVQEALAGDGRQEPQRRLRRLPTSTRRWPPRVRSSFSNQGQICLCGSRIFVERRIYERFKEALVERARGAASVGDPLDAGDGPGRARLASSTSTRCWATSSWRSRRAAASSPAASAPSVPGRCRDGWFVEPTLIEGLGPTCRTNQEEIFGPVATLHAVRRRGGGARAGQRHALRPGRERVDAATCSRAHRVAAQLRERHRLGQLLDAARPAHAVRRREGLAAWAARAAWTRCASSPSPRTCA